MKKLVLFIVLCLFCAFCFAQNFSLDGKYNFFVYSGLARIILEKDNLEYVFYDDIPNVSVKYKIIHIDGIPFIKLPEKFPKEVTQFYIYDKQDDVYTDDKILFLAGTINLLETPEIILTTAGFKNDYPLSKPVFFEQMRKYKDCSSFLTERNKEYSVANLDNLAVDTPWVEGAPGYGIGEGFTIENSWGRIYTTLLIMNGYISYEKPYLYKQNGRVKKIKVKGLKSGKEKVLDVLDTPHPQTVDISFITEPEDIRVTIEDVYPGTKYEDTCIHYMITYFEQVTPYEDSVCFDEK